MKIAFFSDVHANLPALQAFFEDLEKVRPDAVYCLGDLVGYNVWANEVVAEIKSRRIPTIMGNHDEALLDPIKENDNSNRGITRRLVSTENRDYLINLPRSQKVSAGAPKDKFEMLLVHGSPKSINDYLVEDYPEDEILKWMETYQADVILSGHTHLPYHRVLQAGQTLKHVINIGSVGKPKDGDPRLCYALITIDETLSKTDPNALDVVFRRVVYDVEQAMDAIKESEFPDEFAGNLKNAR